MTDTASSSQSPNPSSAIRSDRAVSGHDQRDVRGGSADDQPTVISNRPPLKPPSESAAITTGTFHALEPGNQVGDFELLEYVGGGGMGRVYRAFDQKLSRVVALKALPPEQAADHETRLRFQNEAKTAAQLDHENFARVYHVGEWANMPFLVFEFIEGTDVRAIVRQRGPLALADAVSYTLQVADALTHAADRGIVHRDVKPSNILITSEGRAKVIDLGLARLQRPQADDDLTASGVTLGTFDYISPEQARDPRTVDVRSDIYSLGCTFFFMLTGRPPFPEGTVLQKLLQHQGDSPPDVRQFRPDLPDAVSQVLRRMLAKDPRRRYQTPLELVEDLLALAERVGLRPLGPGRRVWVRPPETKWASVQQHLPWIAPVVALLCTVLLLDFLWSSPTDPSVPVPGPLIGGPEEFVAELPDPLESRANEGWGTAPAPEESAEKPPAEPRTNAQVGPTEEPAPEAAEEQPTTSRARPAQLAEDDAKKANSDDPPSQNDPSKLPPDSAGEVSAVAENGSGDPIPAAQVEQGEEAANMPASTDEENELASVEGADWAKPVGRAGSAPEPTESPRQSGVLVVDGEGGEKGGFASLSGACAAAHSGDVIELRFNGHREERPVSLTNMKLTVRSADGYRPVLVFRPNDPDPVKYPRSMIAVTGGRLNLVNVAMWLEIPSDLAAQQWSLFEVGRTQTVRMERCSMTICSAGPPAAYENDVAFLRARQDLASDMVVGEGTAPIGAGPQIELFDCVARGEAVFLHAQGAEPLHLVWQNGLLVTPERLLRLEGGQRPPRSATSVRVELEHLTAVVRKGLCRMRVDPMAPHQLPLEIECSNSILIADADGPLLEQLGDPAEGGLQDVVRWNGDRNFYQGVSVFWRMAPAEGETPSEQLAFDDWQTLWGPQSETLPTWGQVEWKSLPATGRSMCSHQPSDYRLDEDEPDNPALGAASDGANAGARLSRLPETPSAEDEPAAGKANDPPRVPETAEDGPAEQASDESEAASDG